MVDNFRIGENTTHVTLVHQVPRAYRAHSMQVDFDSLLHIRSQGHAMGMQMRCCGRSRYFLIHDDAQRRRYGNGLGHDGWMDGRVDGRVDGWAVEMRSGSKLTMCECQAPS